MTKSNRPIIIWLLTGAFLVALMVVVGGITRLTQSGLSMVDWNLIIGSVPPLNDSQWQEAFEKYKETPEFKVLNYNFTLNDFKSIFWWEYIHRLLGRLIGLIFLIPFTVFLIQKRIDRPLLKKLILIFILGAFQGFLGWFMVKSGLVRDPHVSHYRLAAHLIAALTLFSLILWIALELIFRNLEEPVDIRIKAKINKYSIIGFILLSLQIVYGAFVAGLKAGLYYNTWPKMGIKWIPKEVSQAITREGFISLFDNVTVVQFMHRYLGWLVAAVVILIFFQIQKRLNNRLFKMSSFYLLTITLLQILLGIFTLVYKVPVILGVLHQLGAVLLLGGFVFMIHRSGHSKEGVIRR